MRHAFLLLAVLLLAAAAAPAAAQHGDHAASATADAFLVTGLRVDPDDPPPGSAVGRAGARLPGGGYVHVVYGKPYARGRQVFGGLVAWDAVWVTGAHQATELVTTVPLTVGGAALEPGVYSLFTTPRPDRWTLHVNRALGMHLADAYDPALDVLAVDAAPQTLDEPAPALLLAFEPAEDGVDLLIRWDRTEVRFPVRPR